MLIISSAIQRVKFILNIFFFVVALLVLFLSKAQAFDGVAVYNAHLTKQDRYNSHGKRLTTVRAILQQDRANVHKYHKGTPDDEIDAHFDNAVTRQQFNTSKITISNALARKVISDQTLLVCVIVYEDEIRVRGNKCTNV